LRSFGFAEAAPKRKLKETNQVEDSCGTPVIDARAVDNNQTDKSQRMVSRGF